MSISAIQPENRSRSSDSECSRGANGQLSRSDSLHSTMQTIYDTSAYDPHERFEFWRDIACDVYLPINCQTSAGEDFVGQMGVQQLSKLHLSSIRSSAQSVHRDRSHIARDSQAYFMISMQLRHQSTLMQAGRHTVLEPGDFALYNTSEPYKIHCETAVDQLIIKIDQRDLLRRVPCAESFAGLAVRQQNPAESPLATFAFAHLLDHAGRIGSLGPDAQHLVQDAMLDVLAASFASLSTAGHELSSPGSLALSRAKFHIQSHLHEESLNRTSVADAVHMSARNLSRLFADDGLTVAAFIRNARLDRIAEDLTNPLMKNMTISDMAANWGLTNFQHFSTMFKKRFGRSAGDYRCEGRELRRR